MISEPKQRLYGASLRSPIGAGVLTVVMDECTGALLSKGFYSDEDAARRGFVEEFAGGWELEWVEHPEEHYGWEVVCKKRASATA